MWQKLQSRISRKALLALSPSASSDFPLSLSCSRAADDKESRAGKRKEEKKESAALPRFRFWRLREGLRVSMDSLFLSDALLLSRLNSPSTPSSARRRLPLLSARGQALSADHHRLSRSIGVSDPAYRRPLVAARSSALSTNSTPQKNAVYTVGEFMTKKDSLHVVKPTTTVDEALEMLVEHRITGFPVIDDDWKLVGVVSDYDLLALDSVSGSGSAENDMFPEVDSTWKTFNEIQKLLSKTNGKVIGELMTPAPLVVRETTNLEDVARLLLATKYRRLPVVDSDGKLVGIITRGNVVRAALQIKRQSENMSQT